MTFPKPINPANTQCTFREDGGKTQFTIFRGQAFLGWGYIGVAFIDLWVQHSDYTTSEIKSLVRAHRAIENGGRDVMRLVA